MWGYLFNKSILVYILGGFLALIGLYIFVNQFFYYKHEVSRLEVSLKTITQQYKKWDNVLFNIEVDKLTSREQYYELAECMRKQDYMCGTRITLPEWVFPLFTESQVLPYNPNSHQLNR